MNNGIRQSLITYLLNHRDFVAGPELSTILGVSTKTISRTVKKLNEQSNNGQIIESQRGRGYKLNYQNYLQQNSIANTVGHNNLTSVQRRNEIIKTLLITSPEKHLTTDVFSKFYVSDSVVSSDLKIISKMLDKYHLQLKRNHKYLWIIGKELNIREAINSLLVSDDVTNISHFLQNNQYVRKQDASFVTRQLNYISEQMGNEIPYPYNINLFSHLYVLIQRYHNVGSLVDKGLLMSQKELSELQNHERICQICQRVIKNLNTYLQTQLPQIEIYYLYQYLTSSRVGQTVDINSISSRVRLVTDYLIEQVTADERYCCVNSSDLFIRLVQHMKPLLNRLDNHIKVKNNLLEQIVLEYPDLFQVVKRATMQVVKRFGLNSIDDEEVGFITVYFAQASEAAQRPINIMIVCTTGFGTAELLNSKIAKRFSDIKIVELVAGRNVSVELQKHPEVQLVVSTINLPEERIPTLVVSAMLTMEDQDRLEKMVMKIRNGVV